MLRRTLTVAPLLSLAVLVGACSSNDDTSSTTTEALKPADGPDLSQADFVDETASTAVDVEVRDNTFHAPYIEVKVGTTVTFTNKGKNKHDVYPVEDGAFTPIEVDELDPGEAGTVTFDEAGDVPYYCTLHGTTTKGMIGAIRVVE
jgi:plastocyanin